VSAPSSDQPDVAPLLADLGDIPFSTDTEHVRRSSRDMSAMLSPTLADSFAERQAAAVVAPRDEAEVRRILSGCARHRVPLVPRGAGTSNFGQSIPLRGGIVLDLRGLAGVLWQEPGRFRARAGSLLGDVDDELNRHGQDLRVFPSSKRVGTIGGYIVGGHAGIGAIRHGVLADTGNILGLRVLSLEEEPRAAEVRGDDVNLVHFSFGTAGVVTEVELPVAKMWPWRDVVHTFPTFEAAAAFALDTMLADGIDVKNVHPVDAAVAGHFLPLALPPGQAAALCMVAPHSREPLALLARRHGGEPVLDVRTGQGPRGIPLYEFTWGHAVWWVRRSVRTLATVIALLPEDDPIGTLPKLRAELGHPVWFSLSCKRFSGRPTLQLALSIDDAKEGRLLEAGRIAADLGCLVADTHRPVLSETSIYGFGERQQAFKAEMDPYGLLNPGKIAAVDATAADTALSEGLSSRGFSARR
jgi:FAD/FMN-containing dehydrogenase